MTALLEARSLDKSFTSGWRRQRLQVLSNIDLAVDSGEILALIGESGGGKSTLARCLVRLHEPDSGTIQFAGDDVLAAEGEDLRQLRRRVQLVQQDAASALDPRWTVGRSIAAAIQATAVGTEALLERVHLPAELAGRYPHQLSGGQRQRVGIARALATEPQLLILDEPVSALDGDSRRRILNLLDELRRELGLAMIFIGHDLNVVRRIADRVAVLYFGRIVESGTVDQVLTSPRHPYSAALRAAAPNASAVSEPKLMLDGDPPSLWQPLPGCALHPRCRFATDLCRQQRPMLRSIDARQVACHHADDKNWHHGGDRAVGTFD